MPIKVFSIFEVYSIMMPYKWKNIYYGKGHFGDVVVYNLNTFPVSISIFYYS